MRATLIDPRDQTTQVDNPTYRVYFWTEGGGAKEEWELSGADLPEVLEWIPAHSTGRSHSLWAVTRSPGEVCLIRLQGIDLDSDPDSWPDWAEQTYSYEHDRGSAYETGDSSSWNRRTATARHCRNTQIT
jgi:hypothetical protein